MTSENHKVFFNALFEFVIKSLVMPFAKDKNTWTYLLQSKDTFFTPNELIKIAQNRGFKLINKKDFLFDVISVQYFSAVELEHVNI